MGKQWRWILACLMLSAALPCLAEDKTDDDLLPGFREDFRRTLETGYIGPVVAEVFDDLELDEFFLQGSEAWGDDAEEKSVVFCAACNTAVQEILDAVDAGASADTIFNMTVEFCIDFNISSPVFCENMMEIAKPQLTWIVLNSNLTGKDICGTVFIGMNCQSDNPERVWQVSIPDVPKPPLSNATIPTDAPTIKVLHLADTHFDLYYLPGSNANCGERFFCCREESGPVLNESDAAGYWGDFRDCDSPRWTLEALYTNVLEQHPDISFIVWTGDIVPHNVWNTSEAGNLETIREAVQQIAQYFPNIPVFPAIGNHEAHPVNAFPQPYIDNEFDISWLYDEIAVLWETWLPAEVASSVMYSAYYVTDIFPDLRILSVNTNYCYGYNWWLLHDSHDPGEVLEWMAAELQRAETDGVYAYIISHIPSGHDDCGYTWSHEYNRIVNRYEDVIAGIFYGHTHKDHFQLFFDLDDPSRATKIGYVAQSQTSYSYLNPGYKVYYVDGARTDKTYGVVDHENWIMDLEQSNLDMTPHFQLLYTAKNEYNMMDMSPASHLELFNDMIVDGSPLFDLYFKNYYKMSPYYMAEGCDATCKYNILCRTTVSDTSNREICDPLRH